ncbi:MAG TPA: UPF0149 family protein [Acetobacteraceae bacterium]|jgi:uncharacterized protein|nr:UPF0149 family protein [Acetobacteraceae bacterium]
MLSPSSSPGSIDLDALDAYLRSDRAPADCMDISQLDGFLAGVIIGPDMIAPSEFLPVIWGGDEPEFVDNKEAETVLGSILGRYNELVDGLAATPPQYAPLFWQDHTGNCITEDWAVGFMQAVALRPDAWEEVLRDNETAILLIPIGIIAGVAEPEVAVATGSFPDGFLDDLLEQAPDVLPGCVVGLREFWSARTNAPDDGRPHGSITIH